MIVVVVEVVAVEVVGEFVVVVSDTSQTMLSGENCWSRLFSKLPFLQLNVWEWTMVFSAT